MDYLHGTKQMFPVGHVLTGGHGLLLGKYPDLDEQENAVELVLEKFRPPHCLSRAVSFYMAESLNDIECAGGYTDHVYLMQPIGTVHQNDVSWWAELLNNGALDYVLEGDTSVLPTCERIAKLYWAGAASNKPLWEYRCTSATVLANKSQRPH
jgi:hypothetical protein